MQLSRRKFFTLAGASAAGTVLASPLEGLIARKAFGQVAGIGYGPLRSDPNRLLDLPAGFSYTTFSRTNDLMNDGSRVPGSHDGMAAFAGPRNTIILVRNHELSPGLTGLRAQVPEPYDAIARGGTTTLVVNQNGQLIKHFASLGGTIRNCAGGPTPWGSWISCEENVDIPNGSNGLTKPHGYNFEVPASATSPVKPVPLVDMGRFNHEAVAVDPKTGIVYETEDASNSLFYRFIPKVPGKLAEGGTLQALRIKDYPEVNTSTFGFQPFQKLSVDWVTIPEPNPTTVDNVRVQGRTLGAARFARGEGIWYGKNKNTGKSELYFCCTSGGAIGAGQVWLYIPEDETIELFVESTSRDELDAPDNIVVAPFGDLILCEDGGGEQYLRGVTPDGKLYNFARNALNTSEFCGACFSPDGKILFVNIQSPGITLAITGPWHTKA
ncbi:phosphatase [Nostoc sp. CENA543]|uniref:alkaline phosphatase PhoX n=1 Tax=Nostoc sp. CENA543 TaxID=1869241 RepID=UPI000CA32994|nr:alkaline phosphatase PhoX [Nostoc sp. CENA543]AUT03173.1 phosphatase [Nostoc sp. CENA543]